MKYTNVNLRGRILVRMLDLLIPIHTSFYVKRKAWGISREELLGYTNGTLGNRVGRFLLDKDLHSIPKAERHDVYHILLNYGTDPENEAAMQFFLLGNGKHSPVCIGVCIISALMLPEYFRYFWRQFKRGKRAVSVADWDFKNLLDVNFSELKNYVFEHGTPSEFLAHKLLQFMKPEKNLYLNFANQSTL